MSKKKNLYDATNARLKEGQFDVEYVETNWDTFGSIMGFANNFGQYDAYGNPLYTQLGSDENPDDLSQEKLKEYGLQAVRMYWDNLPENKRAVKTFDQFLKQVYHDPVHGDVTDVFIYDLGYMLAVYKNSSQYDPDDLKQEFIAAGKSNPAGKIPMAHTIGNPIARAASHVSIFNITLWKSAAKDLYDEYKVPVALALGGIAAYKTLMLAGSALGLLLLLKGRKA